MENLKMKINKSQLSREMGVDRRTVDKYLNEKDFDFDFQPSINPQQIHDFTTLGFIESNENIVFLGPSGVGKTHLASAIGIAAAMKEIAKITPSDINLFYNLKLKEN